MSVSLGLEVRDKIAFLTLAVPPINALDENALHDLMKALDEVENSESVRALVIASSIGGGTAGQVARRPSAAGGESPQAGLAKGIFCSGGNLKYWPRVYPGDADTVSNAGRRVFARLEHLVKPSIAAINGHVIGDGISLALACDIRIATPASTFRLPELDYGFIPGWGTIGRLVGVIGKPLTAELLLFAQEIAAERAQSMGLINRIVSADELIAQAMILAKQAAAKPPVAMLHAKAALRGNLENGPNDQEAWEMASFKAVWGSPEWQDGIRKLFSKENAQPIEEKTWLTYSSYI